MYANTVRLYSWTSPRRECREQEGWTETQLSAENERLRVQEATDVSKAEDKAIIVIIVEQKTFP